MTLNASITPAGTLRYAFNASATRASLTGTKNLVYVTLSIANFKTFVTISTFSTADMVLDSAEGA